MHDAVYRCLIKRCLNKCHEPRHGNCQASRSSKAIRENIAGSLFLRRLRRRLPGPCDRRFYINCAIYAGVEFRATVDPLWKERRPFSGFLRPVIGGSFVTTIAYAWLVPVAGMDDKFRGLLSFGPNGGAG